MASREELEAQLKEAIAAGSDDVFEIAHRRFEAGFAGYDARQREHLAEAEATEATMRSLPRVGATLSAWGLLHRALVLREMATMTEEEERAFRAKTEVAA